MAQPPSSISTHQQTYLSRPCSNRRLQRGSCTGSSQCLHTAAVSWCAKGHTYTLVCVCVCVKYVLLTVYLLHFISNPNILRLPFPFCIPAIPRLRYLPCYTSKTVDLLFLIPNVVLSHPSHYSPLDLGTPGHEQCHHRPIRQLWSLSNARPFFARAAEE